MLRYILGKLLLFVFSLMASSLAIFVVLDVIPGDPAQFMLGIGATEASLAALRSELGLNLSAPQRYWHWITGMVQGDFGISYTYRTPVLETVTQRLMVSLPLALMALGLVILISPLLAIIAAHHHHRLSDRLISVISQIGIAVPNFWLAIILIHLFALSLGWFSAGGFPGWEAGVISAFASLTLPAVALAIPQIAILTRIMREELIANLEKDYIRTARAKGLSRQQALVWHGFRNALLPVLTILGMQFSFLIAGAIIIENIFALPGLGRLIFQAIAQRDLIMVESVVFLLVFAVMAVTLLVDLAHVLVDPRIRRQR